MPNRLKKLDKVIRELMNSDEPPEWAGRQPPEFKRHPKTSSERASNYVKYVHGFPWIVVAEDKGGMARYFCAICSKGATVMHLLSEDHIEKTTFKYEDKVGYYIPLWMAGFTGISTTSESEHLFSYDEQDIWPDVCSECNCNLADAQRSGCNVCRSGQPQAASNTDEFEDNETDNDGDRRPRTTSSRHDDEEGRGRGSKHAVTR